MEPTEDRTFEVRAIGVVSSMRRDVIDDDWGNVQAVIALTPAFEPSAVAGLAEFSHLEVVYLFDRVDPGAICTGSRRPRGNPAWPEVGIFAQRAKDRPNRIGLTVCELVSVAGTRISVRGLDAVDGTPVLDIKPYMSEFAPRGDTRQPTWSHELMATYF